MSTIVRNAAHCHVCDTIIHSTYRHDFQRCQCPTDSDTSIYVDGGHDYLRRGVSGQSNWTDLSIVKDD